jgi:hypothetical protein
MKSGYPGVLRENAIDFIQHGNLITTTVLVKRDFTDSAGFFRVPPLKGFPKLVINNKVLGNFFVF